MRIVSLLPSATEIVCALGLGDQLVGVSHGCDFPASIAGLPRLTHTAIPVNAASSTIDTAVRAAVNTGASLYSVDTAQLATLAPDLVVTQGLCAVCAVSGRDVESAIAALPKPPAVINLEPLRLADVLETVERVGIAAGEPAAAASCVAALRGRIERVAARSAAVSGRRRRRVALLEWLAPPFTPGHWTPELIELAGGVCCLGAPGERSRTTNWAEVAASRPDLIVIACCGLDLDRTLADLNALSNDPAWRAIPAVQRGAITLIDGNHYFSRPGPRLVDSLELLAHRLHPAIHPRPSCWEAAVRRMGLLPPRQMRADALVSRA